MSYDLSDVQLLHSVPQGELVIFPYGIGGEDLLFEVVRHSRTVTFVRYYHTTMWQPWARLAVASNLEVRRLGDDPVRIVQNF